VVEPRSPEACVATPETVALLRSLGATPEQITEAEASATLISLAADLVFRSGESLSAHDLAGLVDRSVGEVIGIWEDLGVDVPGPDAPLFSSADVAITRTLSSVDMFSAAGGSELLHVVGSALARVADAGIAFYVQNVESDLEDGGADVVELIQRNSAAARKALDLGAGLGPIFAHHMRDAVTRQRLAQAHVSDRALFRVAVGFVDLVGFTPLSHRMSTRELSAFVGQFESKSFRIASENQGRIVKQIGDEVMFVALDPVAGCELALALMDEFADERIQPRGGLAFGDVVARQGDYFGEVVNLASRLADLAIPGEVLVDDAVRRSAEHGPLIFESAGRRQLKGFEEPVLAYSVLALATGRSRSAG
jgi:class 3 adenylate cyclase